MDAIFQHQHVIRLDQLVQRPEEIGRIYVVADLPNGLLRIEE